MFKVRFVEDDALPEGQLWVIGVDDVSGDRFIFMKQGAVICPSSWEDVWQYGHLLNAPGLRVAV